MERRSGGVGGWVTVRDAASSVEWRGERMSEAIAFGVVPVIRLGTGEPMVLASVVRGIDRRLTEHDA